MAENEAKVLDGQGDDQGNPPDPQPSQGDDTPQYEPLPEGFDPSKYGLIPKEEHDKTTAELKAEAEAERLRVSEAQRAFHEKAGELNAIKQQQQQQPSGQPQITSLQAWEEYQRTGDAKYYDAYVRADIREKQELSRRIEVSERAAQEAARFAAAAPIVQEFGFTPQELDRVFDEKQGGKWYDYDEAAMVAAARKAGGIKKYIESLRREGAVGLRSDSRRPSSSIPSGMGRRSDIAPQEPNWNDLDTREMEAFIKANPLR